MSFINLVLVNQEEIHRLNKKYRGQDKPTTVLSFCYWEKGRARSPARRAKFFDSCLGEIVVCPQLAEKQKISIEKLVVHGLRNLLSQIPAAALKRPG